MDEQRRAPQRQALDTPAAGQDGMMVLSYVVAGILFYGGLGWLGDHYLHRAWLLPLGLVVGFLASIYVIFKRFGSQS